MATINRSIVINAPADTIQEITDDPDRLPEWYAGIEEVRTDGLFPKVGGKAEMVYKAAGVTFTVEQTAIEVEPGRRTKYELQGMITGTYVETMEPEGDATRYTLDFDYEMPGGGVGKVIDKLFVERMNTQQLEQSLQNLKALVEA
ncbi:MAG: SRPBCC family protein [Candidatus Promineifilaceae bacterium]